MQWWWVLVVAGLAGEAGGAKILFFSPFSTRSHLNFFDAIINALTDHGHNVTLLSNLGSRLTQPLLRDVVMDNTDLSHFSSKAFQGHKFTAPLALANEAHTLCVDTLARREVQMLLKEEFDLVLQSVVFSDCFLSVVHHMNVPYIWVTMIGMVSPLMAVMGNPEFPSFTSSKFISAKHPLTFSERAMNTLTSTIGTFFYENYVVRRMENECRQRGLCPPDMPSLNDIRRNSSLILINSVQQLEGPVVPYVPTVVHAGGIHCRPAKPLPQDLDAWVAGAGSAGFIFFSLGSVIKSSSLPPQYRAVLLEVFGSLQQRVLWKWDEDTMDQLPPNVRLAKWLPQQDILGDPRLRLFVTHGGLLSTQEATYHAVPVLGLPVFVDQFYNMFAVEQEGYGKSLKWEELTPESLREAILHVMNNQSMKKTARERSAVMQDQLVSPQEAVNFWVQYVIDYQGAPHLRSPALTMPWYLLYNVDVWATVLVVQLLAVYLLVKLLTAVCRCLRRPAAKKKRD